MPPTSKKLGGHIALGLYVRLFVRPYVTLLRPHIFGCMLGFRNFMYALLMKYLLIRVFFFFFAVRFCMELRPFSDVGILANENLVSEIAKKPLELC